MRDSLGFGILMPMMTKAANNNPGAMPAAVVGGTMNLLPGVGETSDAAVERRRSHRYPGPFRATVRGVTAEGGQFMASADVRDVSAGGTYLRMDGQVAAGATLTIEVFVCAGQQAGFVRVGEVVRTETLLDLRCGAAVRFDPTATAS